MWKRFLCLECFIPCDRILSGAKSTPCASVCSIHVPAIGLRMSLTLFANLSLDATIAALYLASLAFITISMQTPRSTEAFTCVNYVILEWRFRFWRKRNLHWFSNVLIRFWSEQPWLLIVAYGSPPDSYYRCRAMRTQQRHVQPNRIHVWIQL